MQAMASLHSRPITLEFENITYSVHQKKDGKQKVILDGINGRFLPSRMTAVLGPSGSGKTTLLNVLSGFKIGNVEGKITVNGKQLNRSEFRKQCCYITQEFAMLQLLTVRETLDIAASFKLSSDMSKEKRLQVIEEIARILGLTGILDSQVRFISGGEKKRLSIGVELVTNPPVMFFDEPTSGLDSSSSLQVIKHLQNLAHGGRTIVVVIHQPSSRIFQLFDDVYLISEGHCLYNGPISELVPTLEAHGFPYPEYYNRADFAIEVACKERGTDLEPLIKSAMKNHREIMSDKSQKSIASSVPNESQSSSEQSPMLTLDMSEHKVDLSQETQNLNEVYISSDSKYPVSSWRQFWILFKRTTLCINREVYLSQLRIVTHILVASLLGVLYYGFGNDADKVFSNYSFIFFNILFLFFGTVMPTVLTFPLEMGVFVREHQNNWYSLKVYYFAKVLADLPLQIICPTLFVIIGYYLTSQPPEYARFFMLLLVCILVSTLAQTMGNVCGAAVDIQLAVFIVPSSAIPMFLLSGFFLSPKDLTSVFQALSYLSYFKYAFEAAVQSIFGYNRDRLPCSQPYCHYRSLCKFIKDLGMVDFTYWDNIAALVAWIVVMQFSLYFVLKWRLNSSKNM